MLLSNGAGLYDVRVKALSTMSTMGALGNRCAVLSINCHPLHVTAFYGPFHGHFILQGHFSVNFLKDFLWEEQGEMNDGYFEYDGMTNLRMVCFMI